MEINTLAFLLPTQKESYDNMELPLEAVKYNQY